MKSKEEKKGKCGSSGQVEEIEEIQKAEKETPKKLNIIIIMKTFTQGFWCIAIVV